MYSNSIYECESDERARRIAATRSSREHFLEISLIYTAIYRSKEIEKLIFKPTYGSEISLY